MKFNADNWYTWSYGDSVPYAQPNGQRLVTSYGKHTGKIATLSEALLTNAKSTIDHYPNKKFDLLFSGGIDSELVLRTYLALGHPINVNIFRYEKDFNIYDVSFAVIACERLDVPYKIIDFNLEKFYENEAEHISDIAKSDRPRALVQLAFLDYVDGVPISASSDCRWYRPHEDYEIKAEWMVQDFEHDIALDRYAANVGREAIMQWYKWTPDIVLSWANTEWFKRLVDDQIYGKCGVTSTKIEGYREVYPDMIEREKKTGFEHIDHLVRPLENFLQFKNGGLIYRQSTSRTINQLWVEMTGQRYATTA